MGSVTRHWRWLACSALAVGCLLNPQPDLPTARPDGASGASGPVVSAGGATSSGAGSVAAPGSGGSPTSLGAAGASLNNGDEAGMGGAVELPAAGATGESGQAGDTQKSTVGGTPP
jgi:hypothetical protein